MTSAQVVETSVTNNNSFQNYPHPDDHTIRTTDTPGFKAFTMKSGINHLKTRIKIFKTFFGISSFFKCLSLVKRRCSLYLTFIDPEFANIIEIRHQNFKAYLTGILCDLLSLLQKG